MGRAHGVGPALRALLLPFVLLALTASAAAEPAYLGELRAAARERDLAATREWRILLHYRPNPVPLALPGDTSEADSEDFFLSPDGRTDPRAELDATLAAFFAPEDATARLGAHPQCAFPARRAWLDRALRFDRTRLAWRACPELDEWRETIGARGITLVFAEAFMNNPSSMFGHTLVRLDVGDPGADDRTRDLLAYAVNFAGDSGPDRGALYAVRGITGAYPGYFSLVPYYEKTKEYGEWESRDLWEYRLDLTPEEVDRLLLHLWELRQVAFRYYFFSENCSYQLLGLLEAARPSLQLVERFGGVVIPVDTVRRIVGEAGVAGEISWRPSAVTRMRHLAAGLGASERALAVEVGHGDAAPDDPRLGALDPESQARVLALAHDHLVYSLRFSDVDARRRALAILGARSRVAVSGDPGGAPPRPEARPDAGHGSQRARLAGGWRDGESFVELRWRPAFHDLLDPQGGFLAGAQIQALDLAIRYHPDDGRVDLHEATLADILSLAPRDVLFQPISWKFRTQMATLRMPSVGGALRDGKAWRTHGGAGLSARPWRGALAYALLDGTFDVSGKLDDDYALGAGASLGLYVGDERDLWRGHLFARATRFFLGDTRTALRVGLEQRVRMGRNVALRLELAGQRDFRETWLDVGLAWDFYF